MGNRSKYVAATAMATAAGLAARRRIRLRRMVDGIAGTIRAAPPTDSSADSESTTDEAHAPGHRHLLRDDRLDQNAVALHGRRSLTHRRRDRHRFAG